MLVVVVIVRPHGLSRGWERPAARRAAAHGTCRRSRDCAGPTVATDASILFTGSLLRREFRCWIGSESHLNKVRRGSVNAGSGRLAWRQSRRRSRQGARAAQTRRVESSISASLSRLAGPFVALRPTVASQEPLGRRQPLQAQNVRDDVPRIGDRDHQVRHLAVRREQERAERHLGHARGVGDREKRRRGVVWARGGAFNGVTGHAYLQRVVMAFGGVACLLGQEPAPDEATRDNATRSVRICRPPIGTRAVSARRRQTCRLGVYLLVYASMRR